MSQAVPPDMPPKMSPETSGPGQLKELLHAVSTPAELREVLDAEGMNDEVVLRFVQDIGVDDVLDRIFGLMGTRFLPDKAGDDGGVVRWNIDTPDGARAYHVVIAGGRAEGARGAPAEAKVTLGLSLPDLLRLCAGRLNGVTGVMTGKIKISGDMMLAARMQGWFDY